MDPSLKRQINIQKDIRREYSKGQLQEEIDAKAFIRGSPERIAAFELLDELGKLEKQELVQAGIRQHRERLRVAMFSVIWAVVSGVGAVVVGYFWTMPHVSELEHRVNELEMHQMPPSPIMPQAPFQGPDKASTPGRADAPAIQRLDHGKVAAPEMQKQQDQSDK